MNEQNKLDPTDQQKQVKKAKAILWIGLILIVVVGLAIAVYFVFLKSEGEVVNNVNKVSNTNVVTNINTNNWQTYEDTIHGYSVQYPADYLIKLETDGYIVFDPASMDSPDTTYLNISVTVEDNDFYTYRLGILTSPATDSESVVEEDIMIDGLTGKKITLKNALGETVIHYIISYLGKVYDISAGDSVSQDLIDALLENFNITQRDASIDISDTTVFENKSCVSNNECGAYPCYGGHCYIQECSDESDCSAGTCGQYVTPVPGYCTMIDSL